MMNIFIKPKIYLILAILFFILILLTIVLFSTKNNEEGSEEIIFFPTPSIANNLPLQAKPILIEDIPFVPQSEGGGVDLSSSLVQNSQREIAKILPLLPYENKFQSSSGEMIEISIPSASYQETSWVLDVQVFGINYQTIETDPDYQIQKGNFIKAVSEIFGWMKESNINSEKIIINWGDKEYIRRTAEKWLSE